MFVHFFPVFRDSVTAPRRRVVEFSDPCSSGHGAGFEARCGDFIRTPPLVAALRTAV